MLNKNNHTYFRVKYYIEKRTTSQNVATEYIISSKNMRIYFDSLYQ